MLHCLSRLEIGDPTYPSIGHVVSSKQFDGFQGDSHPLESRFMLML